MKSNVLGLLAVVVALLIWLGLVSLTMYAVMWWE